MTDKELAIYAARAADDKKGREIVVYDLRGNSDVTDYFVIVTAQSKLQAKAVVNSIELGLKELGIMKLGREGSNDSQWHLIDYGSVVVHVFSPPLREYYSLETMWGDAPKVDWQSGTQARTGTA